MVNSMRVHTNKQPREFIENPTEEDREFFDWVPKEETTGFFRYHGSVYHLSQFMRYEDPYWTGVFNSSMTTGVLVKLLDDGRLIVGSYQS